MRELAAPHHSLKARRGAAVAKLIAALDADDGAAFDDTLERLLDERNDSLSRALRGIADTLDSAMERFISECRLNELAGRDLPDATHRLNHVLTLTHDAAHRTLARIEACHAIATSTGAEAQRLSRALADSGAMTPDRLMEALARFLQGTAAQCGSLREHLGDAMLAQSYQDLTGQIIGRVIALVRDVQNVLGELLRVADAVPATGAPVVASAADLARGLGPAIPGREVDAVASQADVDALLADLDL